MKISFALIAFITSVEVSAVSLTKFQSTPEGTSSQVFLVEETKATLDKNTNLFDPKLDFALGIFRRESLEDFKEVHRKLAELEGKFKIVDETLKKRKTSFNDISGKPGHKTILILGDYRVMPESKYYGELEVLFNQLQKLEWNLEEGYRISPDLSTVSVYKDGKVQKTEKYLKIAHCSDDRTTCTYNLGGRIFLPAKTKF